MHILAAIAEFERERIRERVLATSNENFEQTTQEEIMKVWL